MNAPRASVYRTLLDARAVAMWRVPTGMTSQVHAFDARRRRPIPDLAYRTTSRPRQVRPTAHTDTYHGRFVKLVINEQVVEVVEFEKQQIRRCAAR